jgi:hypothetical protein
MNEDVTKLNNRNYVTSIAANAIGSSEIGEDVVLDNKSISSSNYLPGVSGWKIDGYGNSEFANVYVRGDINAYSGTIGYWNISQPLVKRTFGDYVIYGTLLESSDLGLTDDGVTSGTYVGLFKSYIDEQISVLSASRDSEIATITVASHNYSVGDYIKVSVVEDSSFNTNSSIIVDVSDTTYKYYNAGSDVTIDQISGYSILAIKDIAGLYLRDYSKSEFDYGYFSNTGVKYVSAEDVNLIENPSFEYKDIDKVLQTSTTSWTAGTGLTLATLDIAAPYQSDSVYGGKLTWSSSGLSTYLTATIDYAAGDNYGIFNIDRSLYFGISLFPYYVPVAKTITSIESYTTGGYYLKVNSTSHGFSAGDTVFLDVDAKYTTTTHSPHTIADGTSGYTFTVLASPAPAANYFYVDANGTFPTPGIILTLTAHADRSNSVYKVYEAALDLSAIRLRYGNGSTTAISSVLSTATKAQWDAGVNKYLLSNANTYMLAYLDNEQTGVDIPAMYKTDLIIIDGESIKAAYKAADPTNFATSTDIYLDIPGWLLKHDGNGVVSDTKLTDSVSIGYIADNAYLSTASNFFYGSYLETNRWYGSTDDLISYNPAQASIEGTKTWLDINLTGQSAHLDYFDYIGFRNNTFSKTMLTRPSLGMYDSTAIYVPFPDSDYDTTTLTSGQYQYKYFTDAYRNISSTLKLITGDRSTGFELSARVVDLDSVGAITPAKAAVISAVFDQNDFETTTIRMASDRLIWTEVSDQITTAERIVFDSSQVTLNIPLEITVATFGKSIRAAGGLEVTSGAIRTVSGDIRTDSGDIRTDSGNIYTTIGNIYTSSGSITANTSSLTSNTQYNLSSTTHPFQIGLTSGDNVRMDNNGIQAVSNGATSGLNINTFGGDVTIGSSSSAITIGGGTVSISALGSTTTVQGDLVVAGSTTLNGSFSPSTIRIPFSANSYSLSTTTHPFQIGASSTQNLRLDNNGIQSVYTSGTAGALNINTFGGTVSIGSAGSTVSIPGTLSLATLSTTGDINSGGNLRAGTTGTGDYNTRISNTGYIQTYTANTATGSLKLNYDGGNTIIGGNTSSTIVRGPLTIGNTTSASDLEVIKGNILVSGTSATITANGNIYSLNGNIYSSNGDIYAGNGKVQSNNILLTATGGVGTGYGSNGFQLGAAGAVNLQMDRNSIQVYSGIGTDKADISINALGGNVILGGVTYANGNIYSNGVQTISSWYSNANDFSAFVNGVILSSNTSQESMRLSRKTTNGVIAYFYRGTSTDVGSISVTTTATSYVTSSDYRLKENVVPLTGAIDRLMSLKPSRFNFKIEPDETVDGFIAHEVAKIVPQAVTGVKDDVDSDGNPRYQGIDQSKIIPLLTAALQEAIARIKVLENK